MGGQRSEGGTGGQWQAMSLRVGVENGVDTQQSEHV